MTDCIFCKIVRGEIPAKKVHEDENTIAFHDIQPQAPTHILVIPKEHVASLDAVPAQKMNILSDLFATAQKVARDAGIVESGYRTIINNGPNAGQVVFHLHLHVMGGKRLPKLG